MTADQTPLSPEPGPDAGIDDIQADIEHTRKELELAHLRRRRDTAVDHHDEALMLHGGIVHQHADVARHLTQLDLVAGRGGAGSDRG